LFYVDLTHLDYQDSKKIIHKLKRVVKNTGFRNNIKKHKNHYILLQKKKKTKKQSIFCFHQKKKQI